MNDKQAMQLIAQLIRDTSNGVIKWHTCSPPQSAIFATNYTVLLSFGTEYRGASIVIFERRYKVFHDEDAYHWESDVVLGITAPHDDDVLLWEFSGSRPLYDLFSIVREKESSISNVFGKLLDSAY